MRRALYLLMFLSARAGATVPCEQLYQSGSAVFDGDGSLSVLTPNGDGLVWSRRSGGSTRTLAPAIESYPLTPFYYDRRDFWADAASDTAWFHAENPAYRLGAGGATESLSCARDFGNGPRQMWAGYRDGHWSIVTTCGQPSNNTPWELWLYRADEGAEPRQLGNYSLTGVDDGQPPVFIEDASGRYTIFAGGLLLDVVNGVFTATNLPGTPATSPRFASDANGATLFALGDGEILWADGATGSWTTGRAALPLEVRDVISLEAIDRARVVVEAYTQDGAARIVETLHLVNGAWQAEGTQRFAFDSHLLHARDQRLAVAVRSGDSYELQVIEGGGAPSRIGPIQVHAGQEGACGCSFASRGPKSGALALSLLLLCIVIRRRPANV